MAPSAPPVWSAAATAAAVRLAAEAGTEVDDLLDHGDASVNVLAHHIVRLQESAEITEVATDLAALLWAECEDVPPIATILEEPSTQAALEAVAEARRQAAARLAGGGRSGEARQTGAVTPRRTDSLEKVDDPEVVGSGEDAAMPAPPPTGISAAAPAAAAPAAAAVHLAEPSGDLPVPRSKTGAMVAAAAAAAIFVFGRKLRRA